MKGNCAHCPVEVVEGDLAKRAFILIECNICGAYFYSIGNGKKVPGWEEKTQTLTPKRHDVVVLKNQRSYRAWQEARKSLTRR